MSNETLNKAITSCFAKIARVDGSIGNEEMDIINSSEILKKYKFGSIDNIDTKNFFNKIQSEYGDIIRKNLNDEEKEVFIGELVSLIKADDNVHDHEFFLLGHVANSIGYSPEKVAEVIKNKGISGNKSSGWFSWLFGLLDKLFFFRVGIRFLFNFFFYFSRSIFKFSYTLSKTSKNFWNFISSKKNNDYKAYYYPFPSSRHSNSKN